MRDATWPDSRINITVGATIEAQDGLPSTEYILRQDAEVTISEQLDKSLINLDHYFQPPADLLDDYRDVKLIGGQSVALDYSEYEFEFDIYADELRDAIECRANEDGNEPYEVADHWRMLASKADHVPDSVAAMLSNLTVEFVG